MEQPLPIHSQPETVLHHQQLMMIDGAQMSEKLLDGTSFRHDTLSFPVKINSLPYILQQRAISNKMILGLFVAQRFDGIHLCSLIGGIVSKEHTDRHGEAYCQNNGIQ